MKPLGFAVELPIPFSTITSISGCKPRKGKADYRSNGTESNQPNAVIIPFEDVADMFSGYTHITNTQIGGMWNNPDTAVVTVNFAQNTVNLSDLGFGPFNPFIFVEERGREIHMADKMPTALANPAFFKKGMDNSDVGAGRTYKTANNLPWVIALPTNFEYPHEMANIQQAYLKFMQWAAGGGTQFQDWYNNREAGYRNPDRFYRR
jgi:LruC domain-containing protein